MRGERESGRYIFSIILALFFSNLLIAQPQSDSKDMFLEAESYFLFEEYTDALPLYQKILRLEPDNYNICYKIGICYLNDPYQKQKSIQYLEKAIQGISKNYKENSYKEKQAPPDAYFYLGNAYRVNNKLKDAIKIYKHFKEILDPVVYDVSIVDKQIKACEIAITVEKRPNYIVKQNLGDDINSRFAEINPLVSGDESTLVFTKKLQFYDAVFYSKKENGKWGYPINLTPSFELDGNSYCTGLSWDGSELFVYRSDGFDGNIYYSYKTADKWTKLEKLNDNINTKYWESHASLSPDGKTLYFTSNRKGGYGGLDIYTSKRSGKTDWGVPVNLGPVINSEYNEDTPFLTGDGKTIYFSSQGHYNMGGFDIFYSTLLDNGNWAKPVNAGYPINTTSDDLFFVPVKMGEYAYYSMFDPDNGYGLDDIYRLEIYSDLHPRKFILKGLALKDDKIKGNYNEMAVKLIDKKTNKVFSETEINNDGTYSMNAQSGSFDLVISGKGIDESRENLTIPVALDSDIYTHETKLTAITEIAPTEPEVNIPEQQLPKLEIETENYSVTSSEPIAIKLNVDKNSSLDLSIYCNDTILKEEHFDMNRKRFVYFYKPKPGSNLLEFTLSDKEGDSITKKVVIEYTPEIQEPVSETPSEISMKTSESYKYLSEMSSGNLKKYLENLDFDKNYINSTSALYEHLIKEMPGNSYTLADIDNLFINYLAQKSLESFVGELIYPSPDKMKNYLTNLNLDSAGINFPEKLIDYLFNELGKKPYTLDELNYSLTSIGAKNTGNIEDYLDVLNANSDENMRFVLRRLKSNIENFSEPFQLTRFLFSNIGEDQYSLDDARQLMNELSSNFDVNFLYQSMLFDAKDSLRKTLSELNLYTEKIQNSKELLQYLWANAAEKGYSVKDIIDLVEYIKANSDKNLELFRQHLAKFASGNLKAVIQSLDLKEKNISTFADLLNYLINTSKFHNYNRETVYKLLLDIINADNLGEFVQMLKKHAGLEITQTLESLDMSQFSSPYELIQHLIGYTDKYKFTEQDILNLLLKLVLDKGFGSENQEANIATVKKPNHMQFWTTLVLVNALLILLIIILIVRRKKKKSSKT